MLQRLVARVNNPVDRTEYALSVADVRRTFNRAAPGYDAASAIQREVRERLLQRLDYLCIRPAVILDLGTGTGHSLRALRARYPAASVLGIDVSDGMLRQARRRGHWLRRPQLAVADAATLPLASDSVDLIYSSLMLPWCSDPEHICAEMSRVLRPGGALLFTTCGPDTLRELRAASTAADPRRPHVHAFMDMHDIGDALLRHQIAEPVMDVERLRVEYPSLAALIADLRLSGSGNIIADRPRGLARHLTPESLARQYPGALQGERIVATVEVVYGHGWAAPNTTRSGSATEVLVPLARLRPGGVPANSNRT